jgi:hypothetical protein
MTGLNDLRIPDLTEEVDAFRNWGIDASSLRHGPKLYSLYRYAVWPPDDWFVASCDRWGDEGVPHERCSCGVYCARNRSHLIDIRYNAPLDGGYNQPICIGIVGLAGKLIPGAFAWRAQKARPKELWVPHQHWELVKPLQRAYQIPVHVTNPYKVR